MWDSISHVNPSVITDNSTGDIACDSYHRWREDIENMQRMGVRET
jgi:beta-glucosidase/6-phospho-beta-glucosidase/beta-galactosidase